MSKTKKAIYSFLERAVVKMALHLLKVSGTFQTYFLTQLIEYGFDKVVIPLANLLIRKGLLYYDLAEGKVKVKALNEARDNNDQDAYDRASDDLLH